MTDHYTTLDNSYIIEHVLRYLFNTASKTKLHYYRTIHVAGQITTRLVIEMCSTARQGTGRPVQSITPQTSYHLQTTKGSLWL
jgi:hypothetical protein